MYCNTVFLVLACLSCGCACLTTDRAGRFLDKNLTFEQQAVERDLDGPYELEKILSPNRILVSRGGVQTEIVLRGCLPTGDSDTDLSAKKNLGLLWHTGLYLARDSIVKLGFDSIKGVVYAPAAVQTKMNRQGQWESDNQTYTLRQVSLLTYGYSLLDHSDTNYSLYQLFFRAETVAKKCKQGYWATHAEPPTVDEQTKTASGSRQDKRP